MRLGAYPCHLAEGSLLQRLYGQNEIRERHRHRYEFNNQYRQLFQQHGMMICGTSPEGTLVEAIEYPACDFFVAVQYHPEFKSRPNRPHPLFSGLIAAALQHGKLR